MSVLQHLTDYIANTTALLAPLTLPLASIAPLSDLIDHVTTTQVHPTYFPFLRFGAIHAARVSLVWAGMTKNRKTKVPVLQDLFGYLVLCWGGGTIVSLLLSQPPSWLVDPTPWLIYPTIYLLLIQTGISNFMVSTTPTLINLLGAYIDGVTRGTTITALPKTILSSSSSMGHNIWSTALLSGIAVSSGGWVVQGLGLHEDAWKIGKPTVLNGGLLNTLDLWSGIVIGIVFAALTGSAQSLEPITRLFDAVLPSDLKVNTPDDGVVDYKTARAISVLILGSLLFARVITKSMMDSRSGRTVIQSKEEIIEELTGEKAVEVVKAPIETGAGTKATSRKNKGHK